MDFDAFVQLMKDNGWRVHKRIASPALFHKPINTETDRGYWYDPDGRAKYGGLWVGTWAGAPQWQYYARRGETPDETKIVPF